MRSSPLLRRALVVAGAATLLTAPSAAHAQTIAAADVPSCTVTEATLTWGVKESFRSYISGTIAHGRWETTGGATYETPAFGWSGGTGAVAADGTAAEVAFDGGIRFTGHDGLLDTTIVDPTLVVDGPTSARLLLDVSGVSMEDALAGDGTVHAVERVPFVDIDLTGAEITQAGPDVTIVADGAATAITQEGFDAFGSYEAGTAFDPISFAITAECPVETPTPTPSEAPVTADDTDGTADADDPGAVSPWVFAALGGGLVAVGGGATAVFAVRSRRGAQEDGPASGEEQ